MNFIAICLHSLDMRDFHSDLRDTPFLDSLRSRSIFIPMGRGQGHHQGDSLNAELTGIWTSRFSNSALDHTGYKAPDKYWLPKTVIEYLCDHSYDIFTCIGCSTNHGLGTFAVNDGMRNRWLKDKPERLRQFNMPTDMSMKEWLTHIQNSGKFYAHIFLRETHRPWTQVVKLYSLMGQKSRAWGWFKKKLGLWTGWPNDAYYARRAALEKPNEFAVLRRNALAKADKIVAEIFEATKNIEDLTYIVYSNHGEVFDHFRYNQSYKSSTVKGMKMIEGTSHGNYPYEVVYGNMQMWIIPNQAPKVMKGIGRSIDFAPTILELSQIKPYGMDGESMLSYFLEGAFPDRDRYAETPVSGGCLSMVRKDGYKFIAIGGHETKEDNLYAQRGFANHRLAVFDLKSDPYEYVNLIETQQGQEILEWAISRHKELKIET